MVSKRKIRVVICDDMLHICENYKMYINRTENMECVGIANNSNECLEVVGKVKPDLLLLDIQMENETSGIDILTDLKAINPKMKIIILSSFDDRKYIYQAMVRGITGYVVKKVDLREMFDEITSLYLEEKNTHDDVISKFIAEAQREYQTRASFLYTINKIVRLSKSEYEILYDIYLGLKYKDIAEQRFVEEGTIKTLASRIIKKFEVNSMKDVINMLKEIEYFERMK